MSDKLKLLTYEELQMQHFVQFREALAEERYKRMVAERALELCAECDADDDTKWMTNNCMQQATAEIDAELARKGDEEMAKRGIAVHCTVCHRRKKPHGRAEPLGSCYCDDECSGYELDPKPGCLWPNETDEEFGYNACDNATELVKG